MAPTYLRLLSMLGAALALSLSACSEAGGTDANDEGSSEGGSDGEGESDPGAPAQGSEELISSVNCKERTDTAYVKGSATQIKVITIGNKPVSKATGHAFLKMQRAAHEAGVALAINSGFRTMSEQKYLYNCYLSGKCNNGNLAAKPGYSNHQSGIALDLTTSSWLAKNGTKFGFVRTVPSEAWHWEYKGGKDPGGPCSGNSTVPESDDETDTPTPSTQSSLKWASPTDGASVGRTNVAFKINVGNDKVAKVKLYQGSLNFATATRANDFEVSYSFKYTGDKTLTAVGVDASGNEIAGEEKNIDITVE